MPQMPRVTTIDFETEAIKRRPAYPPKPVGVAIKEWGKKSRYYAWGHPSENNCSVSQGVRALLDAWRSGVPLLFHNGKFDYDVAMVHCNMKTLPWDRIHDTLYLIFLQDPHASTFSLKPSAERILGIKPDERDAVKKWLEEVWLPQHADRLGFKQFSKKNPWGAYIAEAPGKLVGRYSCGDVDRTEALFKKLWPEIARREMLAAYDRERKLMPALLENEQTGIDLDCDRLDRDVRKYRRAMEKADVLIRQRLRAPKLDVDSNEEVADRLEALGIVTEFVYTGSGKRSVSKKNLTPDMYKDKKLAAVFRYRNALATCLSSFMEPWLRDGASTGKFYPSWNQVRQTNEDRNNIGTRTGRLSASRLMNVPKEFEFHMDPRENKKILAMLRSLGFPPMPYVRVYFLPGRGFMWGRKDYSQQELRILGHYEDGSFLQAYKDTPRMDAHEWLRQEIYKVNGVLLPRRPVKIINLGDNYSMGVGKMAAAAGITIEEAQRIKSAKRKQMTGLRPLMRELEGLAEEGRAMRTWGGREYFCEPPIYDEEKGYWRKLTYRMLPYLIQGSAADCTKEAICRYYYDPKREGRLLVTVHDEIDAALPTKGWKREAERLRSHMESIEFDCAMLTDGEVGPNWYDLKEEE